MRKKIGIITLVNSYNFGAIIQAKCLKKILEKKYYVFFFNYKKIFYYISENFFLIKIFNFNIFQIIYFLRKIKNDYLNLKKFNKKNILNADIILYGSDEIWNYTRLAFFKNYITFGNTLGIKKIKISYAASFGNFLLSKKNKKIISFLKDFKSHSVRDYFSKKRLGNLNINSKITLDPTLLLNLNYLTKNRSKKEKYLLIYSDQINNFNKKKIISFAKENKLKIFSLSFNYKWVDKNIICTSSSEFLTYFKYADLIVTNMYHGICFSINLKKKNVIIENKDKINKMNSISSQFQLKINKMNNTKNYFINIINKKIQKKLLIERSKSINYLFNSLKN